MRATVRDVAARAGVSLTTVHRALHGKGYVHAETRRRVLEAAAAVQYRTNAIAQSLRRQRTGVIGHLVHTIYPNPFFACVAGGVEAQGRAGGLATVTCNTHGSAQAELDYVELLLRQRVDGIIFTCPLREDSVRRVQESGVPVCVVERPKRLQDVDVVLADNRAGAYAAVRYLLRLGHQAVAYIGGPPQDIVEAERLQGYRQALAEGGRACCDERVRLLGVQQQHGHAGMADLLRLSPRPTAAFVASDMAAMGALQALGEHGLRVPGDLSLVGFDDTTAALASPPLTTVALPMREMGAAAVDLLARRAAEGPSLPPQRVVLRSELVVRASCQPPS